ncbi:hypothetical protein AAF712_000542 [Marasmius tenuissimus]|uniref:N-acetyltransferase domain-containing protein n=1 Tax=Marasmius tenuissimus TaxID=585030 RepID=A0ABR3AH68_9AGAR|nr:hypothetical protein PM082_001396 [Marasmius tenuissimus]
MSSIIIRSVAAADLPQLKDLHSALIAVPYPHSFFINQLIQSNHLCLIAVDESQAAAPVAFITASVQYQNEKPHHIQLLTLGVRNEYQGQGLARQLVCKAIAQLTPSGIQLPVSTHVCTTNTPAQSFYERLGMKPKTFQSRPVIARNVYSYSAYGHRQTANKVPRELFRSRDAYVMEGQVSA